jgi:hypothetical protein
MHEEVFLLATGFDVDAMVASVSRAVVAGGGQIGLDVLLPEFGNLSGFQHGRRQVDGLPLREIPNSPADGKNGEFQVSARPQLTKAARQAPAQ